MKNFTYLVGDNETKNGFIIDPSYDIDKVISAARKMDPVSYTHLRAHET